MENAINADEGEHYFREMFLFIQAACITSGFDLSDNIPLEACTIIPYTKTGTAQNERYSEKLVSCYFDVLETNGQAVGWVKAQ